LPSKARQAEAALLLSGFPLTVSLLTDTSKNKYPAISRRIIFSDTKQTFDGVAVAVAMTRKSSEAAGESGK